MALNQREIVLDILLELERSKKFSNRLIKDVLDKYDYLDTQEKAFIKRVAEGTIETQIRLDDVLDHYSKLPVKKMKPLIRVLLRMSVYQILYMDSVPDGAACNEACKLAQKRGFHTLKGFVNGILRNIAREKDKLPETDRKKDPWRYLEVKYSMPLWLIREFEKSYGMELTEKMLEGLLEVRPVMLRFAPTLSDTERQTLCDSMEEGQVVLRQSPYLPYMYSADRLDGISALPGYDEGSFAVQDVSSALAVEMAGIDQNDFVMDVCAAPGGKSSLAAFYGKNVLAQDLSESKCDRIRENMERMGLDNVEVEAFDATIKDPDKIGKADVLLMDVPCSGLGIMGRKRDIKYNVTPEGFQEIEKLQKQIVATCVEYLKPGGTLLYSTCTLRLEENQNMVRYILDTYDFEPVDLRKDLPKQLVQELEKAKTLSADRAWCKDEEVQACSVQIFPGISEADGFFFAKLRKK